MPPAVMEVGGIMVPPSPFAFSLSKEAQPHPERREQLLHDTPGIATLYGHEWRTKWLALVLVTVQLVLASQFGLAFGGQLQYVWFAPAFFSSGTAFLLCAYIVGATINHACAMIIHEAAHDLTAKSTLANRWIGMGTNLCLGVPSAQSFRRYHLEHHSHQGVVGTDVDLAPYNEVVLVQNKSWRKLLWMSMFMFSYALRPAGWSRQKMVSKWELLNVGIQFTANALMVYFFGKYALAYMLVCTLLSFGLHPVAAHFIQEHYIFYRGEKGTGVARPPQETYSYYGWLNPFILNVGYHNEHHDFPKVAWTRLPRLHALVPKAYTTLYFHTSIWSIFYHFVTDADKGPHSRVVRDRQTHAEGMTKVRQARDARRCMVDGIQTE